MAGWTGLEPATFCVTGRRSNQLSYHPVKGKEAERRFSKTRVKRRFAEFPPESFRAPVSPLKPAQNYFSAPPKSPRKSGPNPLPLSPPAALRARNASTTPAPRTFLRSGAVAGTRTRDRRFRKPLLYPAELPPRNSVPRVEPPAPRDKAFLKSPFAPHPAAPRSTLPSGAQTPGTLLTNAPAPAMLRPSGAQAPRCSLQGAENHPPSPSYSVRSLKSRLENPRRLPAWPAAQVPTAARQKSPLFPG